MKAVKICIQQGKFYKMMKKELSQSLKCTNILDNIAMEQICKEKVKEYVSYQRVYDNLHDSTQLKEDN